MNLEQVVQEAIEGARTLGARNAREAAEMTMGRRLKEFEWVQFASTWQTVWDSTVGDDFAGKP